MIGVLSIEHPSYNAFSSEDVQNIELLSAHATAAIVSTNLYRQTLAAQEQRKKDLQAIAHSITNTVIGFASTIENFMLNKYTHQKERTKAYQELLHLSRILSTEARIFEIASNENETVFTKEKLRYEEISGVELANIIEKSVGLYKSYAQSKEISGPSLYKTELENFETLSLDKGLFGVMVNSLIHNAVEYSNPNTRVSVRGKKYGDHQEIWITNTGLPIQAHETKEIFKQDYRSDSAQTVRKEGAGLGLYVSQLIANLHDAVISVKPSKRIKNGNYRTRFVVSFSLP